MTDRDQLSFDERLGLLLEHEMSVRADRRLQYRLQKVKLRQAACIEDIDYRHPRGLDKVLLQQLIRCRWLDGRVDRRRVAITSTFPTVPLRTTRARFRST